MSRLYGGGSVAVLNRTDIHLARRGLPAAGTAGAGTAIATRLADARQPGAPLTRGSRADWGARARHTEHPDLGAHVFTVIKPMTTQIGGSAH
ncbi:MAG TPA: hypothetical protein VFE59_02970 [Trebonia sp.]|nr:hypothetical protein [Trebonia sp.]